MKTIQGWIQRHLQKQSEKTMKPVQISLQQLKMCSVLPHASNETTNGVLSDLLPHLDQGIIKILDSVRGNVAAVDRPTRDVRGGECREQSTDSSRKCPLNPGPSVSQWVHTDSLLWIVLYKLASFQKRRAALCHQTFMFNSLLHYDTWSCHIIG